MFSKSGKRRRSEKRRMSEHEMAAMRDQIEAERARLREEKDMAEEERNKAEAALRNHESELDKAQSDHDSMKQKLAALEKKIIVGGENLLDKVWPIPNPILWSSGLLISVKKVARISRQRPEEGKTRDLRNPDI